MAKAKTGPKGPEVAGPGAGFPELRDFFAGCYLAGRAAHGEQPSYDRNLSEVAALAFRAADAMLVAREKQGAQETPARPEEETNGPDHDDAEAEF